MFAQVTQLPSLPADLPPGWVGMFTAAFIAVALVSQIVLQVISMYKAWRTEQKAQADRNLIAHTAALTANTALTSANALLVKTDEQTKTLGGKLDTIQEQTNGLTAKLLEKVGDANYRAGGDAERANPTQPR